MHEKSEKELKRIQFYKGLIKHKLDSIKDIIGDLKYRVYLGIVEECDDYNELREMAELDMHIEFVEYIKKYILDKLNEDNVSINDLRIYYYGNGSESEEAEAVFSSITDADENFIALMAMAVNNRFSLEEDIDEPEEIELDESALSESELELYDGFEEPEQEPELDEESLYGDDGELEEDNDDVETDKGGLYGDELEEPEEASDEPEISDDDFFVDGDEIEGSEESEEANEDVGDEPEINEDGFFVDGDELEEDEVDDIDVEIDDSAFFVDGGEDDDSTEDTSNEPEIDVDENEFFVDGDDDIEEDAEEHTDDEIDENDFFVDSDEDEDGEGVDVDTLFEDGGGGEIFAPQGAKKLQSQQGGSAQPKTFAKSTNSVFKDPRAQSVLDFMHRGLSGVIGSKGQNTNKGKTR